MTSLRGEAASRVGPGAGRVLVIGESLIDVVERGDGADPVRHVGGSPLNVAFGLGRLGIETVFATEFGADADARSISAHLASAGVAIVQTHGGVGHTATAIAHIGPSGSASYEFDLEWTFSRPPEVADVVAVHVGSIGALRLPGAERVLGLVEGLPRDVLVTFDPNIRPALMPPRQRTRQLVERFAARAAVVKLSNEDAEWLYPDEHDSVVERLLECGARMVAVTRGAAGSTLTSAEAEVQIPVRPVVPVDTIGAGDSYMSGLLAAILDRVGAERAREGTMDDADLAAIGRIAAIASSITVGRAGAMPPTAAELEAGIRMTAAA